MPSRTLDHHLRGGADRPLPGLEGFPTLSSGGAVNTEYQRREDAIRRAAARVRALKEFRAAVAATRLPTEPRERVTQVRITFDINATRCGALVEWIGGGVGSRRVLRRTGGPLTVDRRSVLGLGPSVGLLALMRSLIKVLDD